MAVGKRLSKDDPLTEHDIAERISHTAMRLATVLREVRDLDGDLYPQVRRSRYMFGPKTLPAALMANLNRRLPQECQIAQISIKRLMANGRIAGTWEHTQWVEVFAYTMKPGGTVWVQSIMNDSGYFVRTVRSDDNLPTDWPGVDLRTKRHLDYRLGVLGLIRWTD